MANIFDVRSAASALATSIVIPPSLTQPGKIYEAWLMLEIAATLKSLRLITDARWEDGSGTTPSIAVFRSGPAPLWDPTKSQQPGFVKISCQNGGDFEIHNSVQFVGASGAKHELDISIERHYICEHQRYIGVLKNTKVYPDIIPICALELKYYKNSAFNIGIIRQFMSIQIDLALNTQTSKATKNPTFLYINSKGISTMGSSWRSILNVFTSAQNVSPDTRDLGKFYNTHIVNSFDAAPSSAPGSNLKLRNFCNRLSIYFR
jgi:hypothetical protein